MHLLFECVSLSSHPPGMNEGRAMDGRSACCAVEARS